jgi:hypothetical protein
MLFSPPQRLSPHNSLRTQDDLRLTPIQWNPLSILVRRTRRPTITTTVIATVIATTLISIPHDLDRLNGGPITTIPQRIARGIALVHLLTVPHLDKTRVSDTAMIGDCKTLFGTHLEPTINSGLSSPRREIPQMSLRLMISKKIVLLVLFPLKRGVVIFLIDLRPLFIIILLPNHQLDILRRVVNGSVPLAL